MKNYLILIVGASIHLFFFMVAAILSIMGNEFGDLLYEILGFPLTLLLFQNLNSNVIVVSTILNSLLWGTFILGLYHLFKKLKIKKIGNIAVERDGKGGSISS